MTGVELLQAIRDVLDRSGSAYPGALWSPPGLVAVVMLLLVAQVARRVEHVTAGLSGSSAWWMMIIRRIVAPGLLGVLAIAARSICLLLGWSPLVFEGLLVLAGCMIVIRVAIGAVIGAFRPGAPMSRAEWALGWLLWVLLLMWLLRWLDPVIHALNAVTIPVGEHAITLLDVMRVVVVLLLLVAAATYLGAVLERRLLTATGLPIGVRVGIAKLSRVFLVVLAVVLGLTALGVDLTALAVIGGAVGVGVGFGLQRIASNFISGFVLLGDRSIRPGDVITIGTRFGVVQELRARYVVVRDRDGVDTLIPNESIITSEVINWSYADRRVRLKLPVQISYRDDPRKAMQMMEDAARSHPRVERDMAPAARVMAFAENGIDLELRFWIRDPEDGVNNVRSDIFLLIWDAFKAAGVTIPYPQRDVHIHGAGSAPASTE